MSKTDPIDREVEEFLRKYAVEQEIDLRGVTHEVPRLRRSLFKWKWQPSVETIAVALKASTTRIQRETVRLVVEKLKQLCACAECDGSGANGSPRDYGPCSYCDGTGYFFDGSFEDMLTVLTTPDHEK